MVIKHLQNIKILSYALVSQNLNYITPISLDIIEKILRLKTWQQNSTITSTEDVT
jgi:hypothetical protein